MDRQSRADLAHEVSNPLEALVNLIYLIKFDLDNPRMFWPIWR